MLRLCPHVLELSINSVFCILFCILSDFSVLHISKVYILRDVYQAEFVIGPSSPDPPQGSKSKVSRLYVTLFPLFDYVFKHTSYFTRHQVHAHLLILTAERFCAWRGVFTKNFAFRMFSLYYIKMYRLPLVMRSFWRLPIDFSLIRR